MALHLLQQISWYTIYIIDVPSRKYYFVEVKRSAPLTKPMDWAILTSAWAITWFCRRNPKNRRSRYRDLPPCFRIPTLAAGLHCKTSRAFVRRKLSIYKEWCQLLWVKVSGKLMWLYASWEFKPCEFVWTEQFDKLHPVSVESLHRIILAAFPATWKTLMDRSLDDTLDSSTGA